MTGLEILENKRAEIEAICRKFEVIRLDVFGSATSDAFDPATSDFDFIVEYAPGADLGSWLCRFVELGKELETVLGRKVDVVMAGAIKRPGFSREVARTRKLLYAA